MPQVELSRSLGSLPAFCPDEDFDDRSWKHSRTHTTIHDSTCEASQTTVVCPPLTLLDASSMESLSMSRAEAIELLRDHLDEIWEASQLGQMPAKDTRYKR